ncbi:MAG: DUF4935 domain-containing protein [Bacteroidales bacterium]|nr:DUF4935 domain-containing protein [Bacteroidales bacterium]
MKLVFDTNIIHKDFHLHGSRIIKLTSAANQLGYDLMIPDIVVDEMVCQYRKVLLQHLPGYAELLMLVTRTQGRAEKLDKDSFINDKTKEYEAFFRSRLNALGIKVINYPKVDIKELVSKELNIKKPFKEFKEGNVGYRDALIWETIKSECSIQKALIEDPQIVFLSENTKDFAGSDNALHPDLVQELKNAGLAENCVMLISDVITFFETQINTELELLEQIKNALVKIGKFNRFEINEEVKRVLNEEYVTEVLEETDYDGGEHFHLPGYMEDPTISSVNTPTIEDVTVRRLTDQTVLIEVEVTVNVDLNFFVFKADYLLIDEDKAPSILDDDWNDHYMWCEGSVDVPFQLAFRTTPKLGKILSVDVQVEEVLNTL